MIIPPLDVLRSIDVDVLAINRDKQRRHTEINSNKEAATTMRLPTSAYV